MLALSPHQRVTQSKQVNAREFIHISVLISSVLTWVSSSIHAGAGVTMSALPTTLDYYFPSPKGQKGLMQRVRVADVR